MDEIISILFTGQRRSHPVCDRKRIFLSGFDLAPGFDLVANGSITHLHQLPGFFKAQNIKQNPASRNKYTINIINGDKTAPAHSLHF